MALERMERRLETLIMNNEIIEKDVDKWQTDTRNILAEVQRLKEEIEEKKSCLNGWCPNWGSRYRLSRKAAKKTSLMLELQGSSDKFNNVGRPAELPGIKFSAPQDFEIFQSSKAAFDQIVEALLKDETSLVGLYGIGGSGKTTLAKKVGNEVKERGIFSEVVIAVVSQNPNYKDIQRKLAVSLGVQLKEENDEEERAQQLYLRFKQDNTETKQKILVILDDVWKKFDLKSKIGFPFGEDIKHCKILLTTRRQDLCKAIRCRPRIPLKLLNDDEGLALLKRHAGIEDDTFTSELKALAIEVAGECKGLPLAIATVGSALKEKSVDEWRLVCQKLKKSKLIEVYDVVDIDEDVYACLKLSYDYLTIEEKKFCFLLCSLFPEDCVISVEDLVCFVIGLRLFSDANSIEEVRIQLRAVLNSLKSSCLLMEAGEECVKMHDLIRDVALWIASKGKNVIMSKFGMGPMEWQCGRLETIYSNLFAVQQNKRSSC